MRTVVLRVVALSLLLLLVLLAAISVRTLRRVPDTVVYFVASDGSSFHLAPGYRKGVRGDAAAHATAAVAALAAGPTASEAARGLTSAVPADTRVISASLNGDTLTVDLSPSFEEGGGSAMMMGRLNQLFYTLTRPEGVSGVVLEVGGRRVTAFSGEGIVVPSPWRRETAPDQVVW